ncbi:MAG: glucose-1-phosphate thymidylyltransferase [Candidatus Eiseniibacteriota bacterium]|jgi:glucose-1-phosphate thymidylyltransferase
MKGLILSGGRGTRLRPITHTSAKQLVPVANRPILFHAIEAVRDAGIDDIGIIVGDTRREIEEAVGNGERFGVRVTYIHQAEPLGLAHAVLTAEPFLGDDSFVMYLGDNLIRDGISELAEEFRAQSPNCQILLARVPDPTRFGVAELDGEQRVVRLVEKPKEPKSDYALVGVYMFDRNIFDAARAISPSWRGELEITDAIQVLIDGDYDVRSTVISGWWKDTGKLDDMLEANRILLADLEPGVDGRLDATTRVEGDVRVGAGTVIAGSILRGPLIIGSDCRITDSYIGPFTSIGDEVTIEGSEIEHSIIMRGSEIVDIDTRIESSLIGRDVKIRRASGRPIAKRFMVGDSSFIEV